MRFQPVYKQDFLLHATKASTHQQLKYSKPQK